MSEQLWSDDRIIAEVDDALGEADSDTRERARRLLRRAVLNEGKACEARVERLMTRITELEAKLRSADALYSGAVDAIAELDAQVKHWRIQHAECTTSLITEERKAERLGRRITELETQLALQEEKFQHYRSETTGIVVALNNENEQLKAQLAAASQWQPVPDGVYNDIEIKSFYKGVGLFVPCTDSLGSVRVLYWLPDNVRLCRRTPAAGE